MNWHPLILSLEVATVATCVTLVVGVALAALLASRRRIPGRELFDAVVTLPLVLPPTVLGYYLLVLLGRRSALGSFYEHLTGGPLLFTVKGCVIAAMLGSLPLVIKSARAALEGVDENVVAAARTLGAGPLRAFFTVQLPLARRGILAGVMLGFARGLGDFGMTLMVGGDIPGQTRTAALDIYSSWQAGDEAQMLGMVGVLSATSICIMWAANQLTRGKRAV
jgi:molybdate transport system permease protein